MLKIGIIGTDGGNKSGHSSIICRKISSGLYDAEVSVIMGKDEKETKEVAEIFSNPPYIAKDIDELLERCDAVMIFHRNGNYHKEPAIKALNAKKAVFVDKPLACTVEDGKEIIETAKRNNAIFHSGSYVRYAPELADIKRTVLEKGEVRSVYVTFPFVNNPDFGGIHFYTHHILTEYLTVFEQEIKSVFAMFSGDNLAVLADNGSFPVFFNYSVGLESLQFGVYFKDGTNVFKEVNISNCDREQLEEFLLATKNNIITEKYEEQLIPVKLSCAIEKSLKTGLKTDV